MDLIEPLGEGARSPPPINHYPRNGGGDAQSLGEGIAGDVTVGNGAIAPQFPISGGEGGKPPLFAPELFGDGLGGWGGDLEKAGAKALGEVGFDGGGVAGGDDGQVEGLGGGGEEAEGFGAKEGEGSGDVCLLELGGEPRGIEGALFYGCVNFDHAGGVTEAEIPVVLFCGVAVEVSLPIIKHCSILKGQF